MSTKSKKSDAMKFLEKLSGGPLTLGGTLRAIRLSDELTLKEFAARLGISVQHLSDLEKNRRSVSPERAARFAKDLGYSEAVFVELALQEIINHLGMRYRVHLSAS